MGLQGPQQGAHNQRPPSMAGAGGSCPAGFPQGAWAQASVLGEEISGLTMTRVSRRQSGDSGPPWSEARNSLSATGTQGRGQRPGHGKGICSHLEESEKLPEKQGDPTK